MPVLLDNTSSVRALAASALATPAWLISGVERVLRGNMGWSKAVLPALVSMRWGGPSGVVLTVLGSSTIVNNVASTLGQLVSPIAGADVLYGSLASLADELVLGGSSWTGVDQTVPNGTFAANNGLAGGPNLNVISASGEIVQDFAYTTTTTIVPAGGQTLIWKEEAIGGLVSAGSSYKPGSVATAMNWTPSAPNGWVTCGAAIRPSGSPPLENVLHILDLFRVKVIP